MTLRQGPIESLWTEVNGRRIHARATVLGRRAPAVVFVHGLGVSSLYFLRTMRAMRTDVHALAPDLPGFGRSDAPADALGVEALARELLGWLDAVGLGRCSFVANSMGCQIAVELAIAAPERVEALILVGPTVDPRWRTFPRQLPRWCLEALREPASLFPILAFDYLRCGPGRFVRTGRHALAHPMEERLPLVQAPALVVRGERDAFVSPEWARRVAALLPRGRLSVLPGVAHAAHYAAPDRTAALIASFLHEVGPSGETGTLNATGTRHGASHGHGSGIISDKGAERRDERTVYGVGWGRTREA
jgi:2-hydroxy-6-oxonona-2,4-dienedioate hydrolase